VGQERQAADSFDPSLRSGQVLIDDPAPIANALQGDGSPLGWAVEESLDSARLMIDAGLVTELTSLIEDGEMGKAILGVATDPIMRHSCTSFTSVLSLHECSGRCPTGARGGSAFI